MEHSGYVGLAGLEVWGQPAASCDKATLTRVHTRLSALKPEPQPPRIALDRPPQPVRDLCESGVSLSFVCVWRVRR